MTESETRAYGTVEDLERIRLALEAAAEVLKDFTPGAVDARRKPDGDLVTAADLAVDSALRDTLPLPSEGWLSEETVDSPSRLDKERTWIVDPIDGTRGFIEGRPEWCVSIALVVGHRAVAGGILAPSSPEGRLFLGGPGLGLTLDGTPVGPSSCTTLSDCLVLTSRSEWDRGEWEADVAAGRFQAKPVGSVALKLALVAAGLADATWTLQPRHEWDVAAGVALVHAGSGEVWSPLGGDVRFNQEDTLLGSLAACPRKLVGVVKAYLATRERH